MGYLVICGPSGVGKSYLVDKLVEDYPDHLYKVEQVTTRDIREDERGGNYTFLPTKRDYYRIKHLLIGCTEINGELYGSIPANEEEERTGIIILNEMGLKDFMEKEQEKNYKTIGISKNTLLVEREGRDISYLEQEKKVLDYADFVFYLEDDEYVDMHEMYNVLLSYDILPPLAVPEYSIISFIKSLFKPNKTDNKE